MKITSLVFIYISLFISISCNVAAVVCDESNLTWSQLIDGACPLLDNDLLIVENNDDVACYNCPVMITGSLIIQDNKAVGVYGFDELEEVQGDFIVRNNAMEGIEGFASLMHVYGDLIIKDNVNLLHLSRIPLITVQGRIILLNNPGINITTRLPFLKCAGELITDEDVNNLDLLYVDKYECCLIWCLNQTTIRYGEQKCLILCEQTETETLDSEYLTESYFTDAETIPEKDFNPSNIIKGDHQTSTDDFDPSQNLPPTDWLSDLKHVEISKAGHSLIWGGTNPLEIEFSKLLEMEQDYITTENDLSLNAFSVIVTDTRLLDDAGINVTKITLGTTMTSLQGMSFPLLFEILIYQESGSVKLGDDIIYVEIGDMKITSVIDYWMFLSPNSSLEICVTISSDRAIDILKDSIEVEDVGTFTWSPTCTAVCGEQVERDVAHRFDKPDSKTAELCFNYMDLDHIEIMHLRHEQIISHTNNQIVLYASMIILLFSLLL